MSCHGFSVGTDRDDLQLVIKFSEMDDDTACLCTFPHNYEHAKDLGPSTVRSMAMLGAAVAMAYHGRMEHCEEEDGGYAYAFLPSHLPEWVVSEIKRLLPVEDDATT